MTTRKTKPPAMPAHVAESFARLPPRAQRRLLDLRALIFETSGGRPEVGRLTETLKWGEPAYLTEETRSGSTIRLGWKRTTPATVYLYFHCRTHLVESLRAELGDVLRFEGNRAVVLNLDEALPRAPLAHCIEAALTYHLRRG